MIQYVIITDVKLFKKDWKCIVMRIYNKREYTDFVDAKSIVCDRCILKNNCDNCPVNQTEKEYIKNEDNYNKAMETILDDYKYIFITFFTNFIFINKDERRITTIHKVSNTMTAESCRFDDLEYGISILHQIIYQINNTKVYDYIEDTKDEPTEKDKYAEGKYLREVIYLATNDISEAEEELKRLMIDVSFGNIKPSI